MALPEIRILSEEVANRIAAGEVIERPAAAVKELVENSLDAGATRIDIEFRNGGKSYIKVSDNGHGMRRDQLLTCLEPHATSKIRTADDLDTVASFGFRGEAVPSIASVAKFSASSRTAGSEVGSRVEVYAGKIGKISECAMAAGTEIVVEDLFCGVPARRKFLKSDNTEASHIIRMCKLYALARPDVEFSLAENSRPVFASKKSRDLVGRIEDVFGSEISGKIIPLRPYEAFGISIDGALSKPGEDWASARNIYAFINGRPVDCRAVYSALREACRNAIGQGRYPAAFLFIRLDPRSVDVNVHPAKREVRLKNEFALRSAVMAAALDTLESFSIASPSPAPAAPGPAQPPPPRPVPQPPAERPAPQAPFARESASAARNFDVTEITPPKSGQESPAWLPARRPAQAPAEPLDAVRAAAKAAQAQFSRAQRQPQDTRPSSSLGWRYLRHLSKRYALFETQSGSLVILSVASAMKRINYDRIVRNFAGEKPASQSLLIPVNIEFDRADDEIFRRSLKGFEVCGFSIEEFGERFYRVCAVPLWIEFGDIERFIKDFVELAREEGVAIGKKALTDRVFAELAVKMARSSRTVETEYAANALLDELFACKSPMFSPDGRRTCKEITAAELRAFFGE